MKKKLEIKCEKDIIYDNKLFTTSLLDIITVLYENGYTCYETLYDDCANTFCLALDDIMPFALKDAIKERIYGRNNTFRYGKTI